MNAISIILLAFAMSTDAFAAAVGKGTALHRPRWSEAVRTGLIFGVIEAATPVVGWAVGTVAASTVEAWDHWIAFTLLVALGLHMLWAAWHHVDKAPDEKPTSHSFWVLAATGFATSIAAMAVGVGLAFLNVSIWVVAAAIGLATFTAVTIGVMVGRLLGYVVGRWAEAIGGVLLIGIGTTILIQHLQV